MSSDPIARLGIMGGTFDPVHMGHLIAASEAMTALGLDRVVFVPAGTPWQKQSYTAAEDRLMMVMLATADRPGFAVSRIEIDRRGPTFTVETLQQLRDLHPEAELFFIGGTDAFAGAPTWHRFAEIRGLASFVVVGRAGTELHDLAIDDTWPQISFVDMPLIEISATDIRRRVRDQRPIDLLVPPAVASYIYDNGLYVGTKEQAS